MTIILILILFIFICKNLKNKGNVKTKESIEQINEVIIDDNQSDVSLNNEEQQEQIVEISEYYKNYSKVYSDLLKINSDTVGWLSVNNTKINYPVVQAQDNEYYLVHSFNKAKSIAGWIFVDYRNTLDSFNSNTIIYGHSMVDDGLMFTTLSNALNSSWYNDESNLIISFSVGEKSYNWKIFSIYTVPDTNDYLITDFTSEEFEEFIKMIKSRSVKDFNTDVKETDKILTLSTCYKDDKHRVVVHAVLI